MTKEAAEKKRTKVTDKKGKPMKDFADVSPLVGSRVWDEAMSKLDSHIARVGKEAFERETLRQLRELESKGYR